MPASLVLAILQEYPLTFRINTEETIIIFWPRYSIPEEWKKYAMQYKKVQKSSWNEPYSSFSFTKQSCNKMALYRWIKTELFVFKPTSTKPQAGKLGETYKIMVATAIYSVTNI